jgi:hypothetical protein
MSAVTDVRRGVCVLYPVAGATTFRSGCRGYSTSNTPWMTVNGLAREYHAQD